MSRRNQDLVSRVRFEVDSRMANASMQALQAHAEKLNQQVAEVNASIKALGDVPDDNPALLEYRKQLRRLNSDLKDVNTTMKDYTRGVKAAGELYRHYAMGNIEDMSIKAIRAGVNGMKKRYDNLKAGGDPGDAEEMRLIEAITTEADVVVKRFKTDYQHVVEEIARGGTVTEQTLKRTRDGLADLMQTAETEAEKNELTNYWQKVGAAIEAVAVENRRLRGEVADREEAMRIAYATDHDGSQQAIHDAEARADAARRENDELRQRLDLKQQQRRELEGEMDINSMQVRALMDRRDELKAQEKEDRAIRNQRVDDANKELNAARRAAKTQQQAYDEQKQTVEKLRTEVQGLTDDIRKMGEVKAEPKVNTEELTRLQEEYNQKVERRKQLEQELDAIKVRSLEDDPHVKQLREEISTLDELIAVSDKYRKQFAKMSDTAFEKGYMGKTGLEDERTSVFRAEDYLKRAYRDKMKAGVADMNPDDPEYQDAAKRVAGGIVQNAQENLRRAIFNEIKGGELSSKALEEKIETYRNMMGQAAREAYSLKDDPEYNTYKYIIAQMEKYLDVARQVEAERQKIAGNEPFMKATQSDVLNDVFGDSLIRQRDKRTFDELTAGRPFREKQEQDEATAKRELKKAQDEESESLGRLNKAKKESAEQTSAQSASSEQLAQKQEQLSQKTAELNQQQDKLNGMVGETVTANQRLARAEQEQTDARNAQAEAKKHEGEAVKKVEDELRGLTDEQLKNAQAYSHLTEEINADTAAMQRNITTEQEATREADRLRSGSIDKMEQALARLRESNRKLDPTIDKEEWERGERAIGQLNLRLEELKKQSAELRREPVLDMMTQRMDQLGTLSRDALTETKKFWQAMYDGADNDAGKLREIEDNLKRINTEEQKRDRKTLEERADRLKNVDNYSVGELREGIEAAKRLQDQYRLTNDELQQLSERIVAAETRIAKVGVEAERQAQRQREQIELMEQQLANGSALTESALKAQVNYWQRLADDPKAAAEAVKQYTANMERAQSLLDVKERVDIRMKAGRLDNMDGYSVSELREGIDAAKKMQDTFRLSNDEVQQLSEKIVAAEVRISQFSVESERAAQRQREQIALMEQQLANGSALTESALKAQVNYWQRLADDPKAAAEAVKQYTANMKQAQDLLDQSQRADIESKAGRLQNLGAYSVSEIREGIDAAKKMQDTFHLTDEQVQKLSEDIVAAEKHVSQFSVENERAAQKQRESVATMEKQLQGMTNQMAQHNSVSVNALKAQHSYWQKLIDDPKTAAENLQQYQDNLAETERLQRRMVGKQGQEALDWFRGGMDADASANDIKEQAAAMKAWRDTLPKETQADVIADIDGYLKKAGVSAKGAAEEMMELVDAMVLADKAGKDGFAATPQEIQLATQSLERQRDTIIATIREKRNLGQATKAEEDQLADLTKKLRSLKFEQDNVNMSQEKMRTLIETPANAVNLDELRAAIKRADGQLRQMEQSLGQNSDEYKRFAEQVRQAKNVMKEMEGQAKASATAWEKAFSRLKTYVVMYMGFNELWQKVSNTARDLMDLSDRMGEVRKTTGFTADEVGRLSENLKKMDVRTSLTSLMEISASAGQLGLKTLEDVQGFTEAANKLMIALPEMGREAATEMMRVAIATGEVDKIRKQLQEGTIEGSSATAVAMEKIASTIDRLRATSASTAPEITDFVKRVGAVGAQSGITIDQVAALGSTVSSLGMRIEMSATALSRMIPAIRNNAFELAKAIGVTPDTIRNLFDTGRGMEVILMILQRIKDTGMDADSVEQMLGMAGMRDIMKDLNQQGARAGIVFSGLSQNVDELRRQLGVAGEAYEENIAIQQEFDKMNETTAAKWERLKNAFEEAFVSDKAQRFLGTVIDGLRKIVDLLMGGGGLTTALATISTLVLVLKTNIIGIMWSAIALGLTKIIDLFKNWRIALDLVILKIRALTAAQWANIFVAAASAVAMLVYSLRNAANAMSETSKAMGDVEKELNKQMLTANKLFRSLAKMREQERVAALAAKEQAKAETEKGKAVEQSADKTDKLSKETDKLAGSEKKAAEQTAKVEEGMKRVNAEGKESARIIREINSKYGAYLGYMLSETASAKQLAEARELINKKLRETITLKQKEAALSDIEQEYGGKVRKGASSTDDLIASYFGSNDEAYARVSVAVSEAAQKYAKDQKKFQAEVQKIVMANRQFISQSAKKDFRDAYAQSGRGASDNEIVSSIASNIGARAESYRASVEEYQKQVETAERVFDARSNVLRKESRESAMRTLNSIMADWKDALARYQKAEGEEKEKLAVEVYKQQRSYNNLFANNADYFTNDKRKGTIERSIENMKSYEKGLRQVADESIRAVDAAERAESKIQNTDFTNGNEGSGNSPWGTSERADSTTYTEMTAEQLVNRREQMNKFVNSLQTDTDVKAVLNEDKALKKAIEAGMSSDMRTVIEWYNTERLKIQDELHARHLTNTGDWLDPKKERGAKKQFRDEMDAYLHELDAYYTERKTRIEKARNDEEITEGEAWRRTIQNDNEWQTRRAELQKLYSRKQKEVTQEELDAIIRIIAERTGDSESFVKAAIAKTNQFVDAIEKSGDKGAAIVHRWMSQVVLDTERSYLKAAQAIGKQMKFIEDTLAKERPYDGITKNLQDNLDKMGVLAAKYRRENEELARQGKGPKYSNEQITAQSYDEMAFYLRQAADAYSIDIDELLRRMVKEGMTATAEEISKSDMLKQAVMGQLRKTYQEVQDAVKKEASQIKKDVEIIWNDDARGIGGMSMKATFDKALAQLGMQQDSVSRANSLIGAGAASDNVASRLAMKQIEVQMRMQKAQYDMYRVQANQRMAALRAEAKEHQRIAELEKQAGHEAAAAEQRTKAMVALRDAENVRLSLGLTLAEETKKEEQQKAELLKIQEESQNRLYTSLREWADLLTSSLQGVFEASHAGDAEYYNERAKLNLTGKGGPGAGTYVVIDDAGTSDATAHYEYLDERQALERQHEIEVQNAQAEAWRKLMDDLNMKMSEQITDWLNASAQIAALDRNTDKLDENARKIAENAAKEAENTEAVNFSKDATGSNTEALNTNAAALNSNTGALNSLTQQLAQGIKINTDDNPAYREGGNGQTINGGNMGVDENGVPVALQVPTTTEETPGYGASWMQPAPAPTEGDGQQWFAPMALPEEEQNPFAKYAEWSSMAKESILGDQQAIKQGQKQTDKENTKSSQSTFAKMAAAANMYGIAYQAMSNENLSTTQKFQAIALQTIGSMTIAGLEALKAEMIADAAAKTPGVLGKLWSQLGWAAAPVFAIFTGLLGGFMGLATSKISSSKSQIAQATGASVGAGRLATGMLTYAEGNVNELTDPASLTPGRQYNVDGADGKTYRARYMGKGAKTHITNGPEFHLVGEAGREAIIDAKTTRLLQMNETGIWRDIQTLYNGGSISGLSTRRRRGGGVAAFAEGNIGEFEDIGGDAIAANGTDGGMSAEVMTSMLETNRRLADLLENALVNGIKAVNKWTGSDGIPAMYNKMQKEAQRHGEKYL